MNHKYNHKINYKYNPNKREWIEIFFYPNAYFK